MAKAAHAKPARRIDYGCARDENRPNVGASDELLASVIASALDAIVVMDADGRITEFNPSAERIFGYRREAAIGALLSELLIPPELRAVHQDGLRRFLATGAARILERPVNIDAWRSGGTTFPIELIVTIQRRSRRSRDSSATSASESGPKRRSCPARRAL